MRELSKSNKSPTLKITWEKSETPELHRESGVNAVGLAASINVISKKQVSEGYDNFESPKSILIDKDEERIVENTKTYILQSDDLVEEIDAFEIPWLFDHNYIVLIAWECLNYDFEGPLWSMQQFQDTMDVTIRSSSMAEESLERENNEEEGAIVRAHSLILSARSDYFRNMLASSFSEAKSKTITLPESIVIINVFVRYLYGGRILHNLNAMIASETMLAACKYQFTGLIDKLTIFLMNVEYRQISDLVVVICNLHPVRLDISILWKFLLRKLRNKKNRITEEDLQPLLQPHYSDVVFSLL